MTALSLCYLFCQKLDGLLWGRWRHARFEPTRYPDNKLIPVRGTSEINETIAYGALWDGRTMVGGCVRDACVSLCVCVCVCVRMIKHVPSCWFSLCKKGCDNRRDTELIKSIKSPNMIKAECRCRKARGVGVEERSKVKQRVRTPTSPNPP